MAVSDHEFSQLRNINPTAAIAARNRFRGISAIRIRLKGIRGGRGARATSTITYNLYIDTEKIRASTIPDVWVEWPQDSAINHVNIFGAHHCPKLGRDLPLICWGGGNKANWSSCAKSGRSLVALLDLLHFVLMNQNFDSPARSVT